MQPHVKIYMKFFGFKIQEEIMCEFCGRPAADIHHLTPRSIAAKHKVNKIDNLMALCLIHHDQAHNDMRIFNEDLKLIHRRKCLQNGLPDTETEIYYDHKDKLNNSI